MKELKVASATTDCIGYYLEQQLTEKLGLQDVKVVGVAGYTIHHRDERLLFFRAISQQIGDARSDVEAHTQCSITVKLANTNKLVSKLHCKEIEIARALGFNKKYKEAVDHAIEELKLQISHWKEKDDYQLLSTVKLLETL